VITFDAFTEANKSGNFWFHFFSSLHQECVETKEPCEDCWSAEKLLCEEKAGNIALYGLY
jgi:hypothetical protein